MLADTSILRRLPKALRRDQLVKLDALAFAIDALGLAFQRMRIIAANRPPTAGLDMSPMLRMSLVADAWAMVTHGHMILELLRTLGPELSFKESTEFIATHSDVTILRNKNSHLHGNLSNWANAKSVGPPLFGVITYLFCVPNMNSTTGETNIEDCRFYFVSFAVGALTHQIHRYSFAPLDFDEPLQIPVDRFKLHAFKIEYSLSKLFTDVQALASRLEMIVDSAVARAAAASAADSGIKADALLEPAATGFTAVVECSFRPTVGGESGEA